MKKSLTLQNLLVLLFYLLLPFTGSAQGYLKAEGTKITDENGKEMIFRGIGLGGWMLQEGYMLGTSGAQHEIEERIEALIGPEKTAEFYEAWLANHTRKIDIDSMAAWGYNLVRLPMHYKWFTPPIEDEPVNGEITWNNKGFEMTDQLLEWCKANNMYLILDLHAAPGGQGENKDISDYDPSKPSLWESEANRKKMIALWRKLAGRYVDEPMLAAYDIINEPNWGFQNHQSDPNGCAESENTPLWDLQKEVTAAIREVDTNHIVIIEGNCWGNNYSGLPELWDDNLVISFHKYWNPNTRQAIQGMLDMRENRFVPIWLGETGENSNTWFTNAIELFENNGIGWAWWPLKKQGYNNPLQIVRNLGYQEILNYWNGNASKPSETEAYESLMQLAENLKLENNIFHPSVVDAMIRQPHSEEAVPFKDHTIEANGGSIIYASDFDMGRHEVAYRDNEVENTTGNAGGQAWNLGYSYRNDGVDIEACQDELTNGYNVGWTEDGEWLRYTVDIEETGNYDLSIRTAATNSDGKLSFSSDGAKITEVVALPNTGGYQEWETTTVKDVPLTNGTNVIRLTIETGGFNINYFEFTGPKEFSSEQPKLLEGTGQHDEKKIDLLFNQEFDPIPASPGFMVTVNGEEVPVSDAYLKEGNSRVVTLELEEPLAYGSDVLVSYSGTVVTTVSGTVVEPFSDAVIHLTADNGIIPLSVPGRIRAEDHMENNGFEFEETTDTGGGQNAGYTDTGDHLDFLIMVEKTGYYEGAFRVSSLSVNGNIKLQLIEDAGTKDLASVEFAATGGWQTWTTVSAEAFYLEKGLRTLRVLAASPSFNINWIELSLLFENPPLGIGDLSEDSCLSLYPNPCSDSVQLVFRDQTQIPHEIHIYDLTGKKHRVVTPEQTASGILIKHNLSQGQYLCVFEMNEKYVSKKLLVK